jgi:hypothetical protein
MATIHRGKRQSAPAGARNHVTHGRNYTCYRKAGWKVAGRNKDGRLTILEILPPSEVG